MCRVAWPFLCHILIRTLSPCADPVAGVKSTLLENHDHDVGVFAVGHIVVWEVGFRDFTGPVWLVRKQLSLAYIINVWVMLLLTMTPSQVLFTVSPSSRVAWEKFEVACFRAVFALSFLVGYLVVIPKIS